MSKIIYIPLEHIDGRYTVHMDRDIEKYLQDNNLEYVKIMPTYETPPLPEGQFLNAAFTSKFKSLQMAEISAMFERGEIADGDRFFFSDIWFPGIENIAYMKYFNKVDVKITGIIHAGSFTDTDFVPVFLQTVQEHLPFQILVLPIHQTTKVAFHHKVFH